jgi:hypothetical protein
MVGSTELINEYVNKYTDDLQKDLNSQSNYLNNINQKNNIIANKHEIQLNQLREIEDKEKLLLTRSRMLQIAQDRNTYKTKIIYTLIAIIFGLFILILFIYTLLKKK